ncbi:hypothetical protein RvY_01432 [Ramazzottius varieornatus]|uniref:NADH dehydrogenase [ubiquinone] 1 beta subcomplex subunit 3 n=1 Tax=Ramazzottius varieornatus TaxID=947166 RepID=A0A1D1URJ0_RAMVA|nr:hypothetical protein RvY_01432 [Ramazzottius varieornatus]
MGGSHLPKIPSYKIYRWERIPELVRVQERLAAHGLKDPWLRNEVWRYHPRFLTPWGRFRNTYGRGFIPGLIIGGLLYLAQKYYVTKINPDFYHWHDPDAPVDGHGHGHGHH